jgi:hypothetical protein
MSIPRYTALTSLKNGILHMNTGETPNLALCKHVMHYRLASEYRMMVTDQVLLFLCPFVKPKQKYCERMGEHWKQVLLTQIQLLWTCIIPVLRHIPAQ